MFEAEAGEIWPLSVETAARRRRADASRHGRALARGRRATAAAEDDRRAAGPVARSSRVLGAGQGVAGDCRSSTAQGRRRRALDRSAAFDRAAALVAGRGLRAVRRSAIAACWRRRRRRWWIIWLARGACWRPRAHMLDIGCGAGRFGRRSPVACAHARPGGVSGHGRTPRDARCAALADVEIALCEGRRAAAAAAREL